MKSKILGYAAGLALVVSASPEARAQFMSTPYPAIIVVPPPAQNYVVPRARQVQKPAVPPPDASAPRELQCHYQGQTRVCE